MAQISNNIAIQVAALSGLGLIYQSRKDYPQAIACHQQCLTLAQQLSDRACEANTLLSLGLAHSGLGKHALAVDDYQRSLAIYRTFGDRFSEGTA
ncbi:MAG: tetratricopeptide repeat protein, partial [Cyanobacteria bacterium J06639_14]